MFGKPVLRGHVRIVREARREWNYREQKWEAEQGQSQEGELDAKNEFRATLNLSKDHADLEDTDWKRFEDLRYAAYVQTVGLNAEQSIGIEPKGRYFS
jgi:hypothetical protein